MYPAVASLYLVFATTHTANAVVGAVSANVAALAARSLDLDPPTLPTHDEIQFIIEPGAAVFGGKPEQTLAAR